MARCISQNAGPNRYPATTYEYAVNNTTPRELDVKEVQATLRSMGVRL
jgi:hypothetical protein